MERESVSVEGRKWEVGSRIIRIFSRAPKPRILEVRRRVAPPFCFVVMYFYPLHCNRLCSRIRVILTISSVVGTKRFIVIFRSITSVKKSDRCRYYPCSVIWTWLYPLA